MARFDYHRSLTPMMVVLVALVVIEATVLHLLLAFWWPALAIALSVVSLATLVWLVALIRSFKRLPVIIEGGNLVWRCGTLRRVTVPIAQIAGLQAKWDRTVLEDRATLNCALIVWPNVVLDLKEPIAMGRRRISRLAHRLDEREAFIAALERLRADP